MNVIQLDKNKQAIEKINTGTGKIKIISKRNQKRRIFPVITLRFHLFKIIEKEVFDEEVASTSTISSLILI